MKKLYLIIHDLRSPGRDYGGLYGAIKGLSGNWRHPMASTWFVSSDADLSTQGIYERLRAFIDDGDNVLVIDMGNPADRRGWMARAFWSWLDGEQEG